MRVFLWPDIIPTSPPSTGFVYVADPGSDDDQKFIAELRDLSMGVRAPEELRDRVVNGRVSIVKLSDFAAALHSTGGKANELVIKAFGQTSPPEHLWQWGFYVRFFHW